MYQFAVCFFCRRCCFSQLWNLTREDQQNKADQGLIQEKKRQIHRLNSTNWKKMLWKYKKKFHMIGNALIRWSKTLVERIRIFLWSIKGAVDVEAGRSLKVEQLFVGFTRNNFCHSGAQVEKELKMAGEKKNAIWALLLSLPALIITFQQNYHNNQLLIKPNETVGLFLPWLPTERTPAILSALFLVQGSF